MSEKFVQSRKVVQGLKEVIEGAWPSEAARSSAATTPSGDEKGIDACCDFSVEGKEFDASFKTQVDKNTACYSVVAPGTVSMTVDESIVKNMTDNLAKHSTLKWQHFGTQTGFFSMYPATQMMPDNCHKFDPRERPW